MTEKNGRAESKENEKGGREKKDQINIKMRKAQLSFIYIKEAQNRLSSTKASCRPWSIQSLQLTILTGE